VYQDLREQIVSVALDPGSRISENELAGGYGVSRTPVREALIRLADDGLVEVFPQLGTYVSRISVREVREAQFIREALECAALPLAAERAGPAGYSRLEATLTEQRAARAAGDVARFFAADEELHRTLIELSGHRKAWTVAYAARAHLDRVRWLGLPEQADTGALIAEHAAIVEHLAGGQVPAAREVLTRHVRRVLDDLDPLGARFPGFFDTGSSTSVGGS
jgi:DNA-binding GntR family transcriptional regulator